ncbi:uncharacterized protein LOC110847731 [Folsomia candida]|uniref:uncharacterized protein LOC110847731 n=1 Tax=Folsomia candida TaxID=158441 RepID=UPI000B8F843D|nr:uncharacterized protein LOC110847731 [Folsomia candida]
MISNIQCILVFIFTIVTTTARAEDYCFKNCQNYFPGQKFSDCVRAQTSGSKNCGLPPFFGIIVLFTIIVVLLVLGLCVRNCMLVSDLYSDSQLSRRANTFNQSTLSRPPQYTVYNIHSQEFAPPYESVGVVPPYIQNHHSNHGFQRSDSESQLPSYDQAMAKTSK